MLIEVPLVGFGQAKRIIDARRRGLFRRWDDILAIPGIGVACVKSLQKYFDLEGKDD